MAARVVSWYYKDDKRLSDVRQMVLEDQAVEWVMSQATVNDQIMSFHDAMENQKR